MEIFQLIKYFYLRLGIDRSDESWKFFFIIKYIVLILIVGWFCSSFSFILFGSYDFHDASLCFFSMVTSLLNIFNFSIVLWRKRQIYIMIESFEKVIEESKFAIWIDKNNM